LTHLSVTGLEFIKESKNNTMVRKHLMVDRDDAGQTIRASGIFLVEAPNAGDRCEAVTSRIDFTRISESWSDAKHDATIPPTTASRLHFLPFPYTFFTRVLESTYLRRTNMRKHPGNDRRPRLVLRVSSSLAICSPFLL